MSRNSSDQFVKFILEIETEERYSAVDEDDARNKRQNICEQQARPSERTDEWGQQQDGWELERHRDKADSATVRSLKDGNGATLGDRVRQYQAGGLRWEMMKGVKHRSDATELHGHVGRVNGRHMEVDPSLRA